MQIIFLSGTKFLRLPKYVNKFLVWHKKFGPAQNILGPVEGQGIKSLFYPKAKKLVMCLLCHHVYLILMWRLECLMSTSEMITSVKERNQTP